MAAEAAAGLARASLARRCRGGLDSSALLLQLLRPFRLSNGEKWIEERRSSMAASGSSNDGGGAASGTTGPTVAAPSRVPGGGGGGGRPPTAAAAAPGAAPPSALDPSAVDDLDLGCFEDDETGLGKDGDIPSG